MSRIHTVRLGTNMSGTNITRLAQIIGYLSMTGASGTIWHMSVVGSTITDSHSEDSLAVKSQHSLFECTYIDGSGMDSQMSVEVSLNAFVIWFGTTPGP